MKKEVYSKGSSYIIEKGRRPMIKKLVVSFTLATVVFAGPAAANLDSSILFQNWYKGQWNETKQNVNEELASHSFKVGIEWLIWMTKMNQKITTELDVSELIFSTSNQMNDYADAQAYRLEEAKRSLHMNELDAFEAERKQDLPEEMENELEEFFKTNYLNGE